MKHLTDYTNEIEEVSRISGIDPLLIEAVVLTESSGITSAYRYEPGFWSRYMAGKPEWKDDVPRRVAASYGLMQVMYTTALEHGFRGEPEHLFVPKIGLWYGAKHLSSLLVWASHVVDRALAAYNGGKTGNEQEPYRNHAYVSKVHANLERIKHA